MTRQDSAGNFALTAPTLSSLFPSRRKRLAGSRFETALLLKAGHPLLQEPRRVVRAESESRKCVFIGDHSGIT